MNFWRPILMNIKLNNGIQIRSKIFWHLKSLVLILNVAITGCVLEPPIMRSAVPLQIAPETALITFISPPGGGSLLDPIGNKSGALIWDGNQFLGFLGIGQYIQYPAIAGEHIFLVEAKTIGGIKANLSAGKSYFVSVERGAFVGVTLHLLTPDDARIEAWLKNSQSMVLDQKLWLQQLKICNFPTTRPIKPKACSAVENIHLQEIELIRRGHCDENYLNLPSGMYCSSILIE
jgi:hypothetical protein